MLPWFFGRKQLSDGQWTCRVKRLLVPKLGMGHAPLVLVVAAAAAAPIAEYFSSRAARKTPKLFINLVTHDGEFSRTHQPNINHPDYFVHDDEHGMADVKDITPDLDRLDSQLDSLEDALEPLLGGLEEQASQLPLLDKAKLFSLTAYAIESLLFCKVFMVRFRDEFGQRANAGHPASLRLQGADAQNHAVFTELKRVQQYFAKIKAIEEPEAQRTTTVNQEAAARILKADLVSPPPLILSPSHSFERNVANQLPWQSDNKALGSKLAEKIAEERAKALLKSVEGRKRPAQDVASPAAEGAEDQASKKTKKTHKGGKEKKKGKSKRS